jgi:hypothetical protein
VEYWKRRAPKMRHSKAANTNNIHDIFNWCDRWCEKCSQTGRCTLFQTSPQMSESDSKDDFFEQLTVIFSATMDMLKEQAERLGIDFDNLKDAGIENDYERQKYEIRNDESLKLAKDYSEKVARFFEILKQKDHVGMEFRMQDETLRDCMDLIQWYHYMFEAKTVRALTSAKDEEEYGCNPYDSLGIAKLLLVSAKRNIAAWGYLYNVFKDEESEILDILIVLQRLERAVRQRFPQAESFIREGLD